MPGPGAKAVVCASGGMDSCVCAAIAASGYSRLYFLHAEYGQRTQATERACFERLARHFKAEQTLVCRLDHLGAIGGSSLTDKAIEVSPAELDSGLDGLKLFDSASEITILQCNSSCCSGFILPQLLGPDISVLSHNQFGVGLIMIVALPGKTTDEY